jgi:DNA polymerase/3'-5' exonuclease PolX
MPDYKQTIIDTLEILRKKEQADKEVWKARAYAKVIKTLKERAAPIESIDDVKGIPGVGDKILDKIKEIIETGHLKKVNAILAEDGDFKIIDELMGIHGIGPAKANELVKKDGVRSIEALIARKDELLNDKQKIGLRYYQEIQLRIPRAEMVKHDEFIMEIIKGVDPTLKAVIAGSYRRGEPNSGDIDVLITTSGETKASAQQLIKSIADTMIKKKYIADTLALGDKKCMAVCRLPRYRTHRRIDLMITKPNEFPFAVLYFTGSAQFNVAMRNWALTRGLSLSEYGLKDMKTGEFVTCHFEAEEDIFRYLDLKYVPPVTRKGVSEVVGV